MQICVILLHFLKLLHGWAHLSFWGVVVVAAGVCRAQVVQVAWELAILVFLLHIHVCFEFRFHFPGLSLIIVA